jgi:hypothetical protein
MGLDTVELLTAIETYFNISITNKDAEQITTVDSMASAVAKYLDIVNADSVLYSKVLESFCHSIGGNINLLPKQNIADYLSIEDAEKWQQIEQAMGLQLPRPCVPRKYSNKIGDMLLNLFVNMVKSPSYNWQSITVRQFITAVCANNYQKLLQPNAITTTYEIYIALVGITAHHAGVDYYEISPNKWFTSDLGMD